MFSLAEIFPNHTCTNDKGIDTVNVALEDLIHSMQRLCLEWDIDSLMDMTCVDYLWRPARFDIIYNLLSLRRNVRAFIKVAIKKDDQVPSMHEIFAGSVWYEREIYDMYGVRFINTPDSRRILMDEDFIGHPLRKDFPLTGHVEVRYDLSTESVIEVPVDLEQDYRPFDFLSPWQGPKK